jgi:hypothetical protein
MCNVEVQGKGGKGEKDIRGMRLKGEKDRGSDRIRGRGRSRGRSRGRGTGWRSKVKERGECVLIRQL